MIKIPITIVSTRMESIIESPMDGIDPDRKCHTINNKKDKGIEAMIGNIGKDQIDLKINIKITRIGDSQDSRGIKDRHQDSKDSNGNKCMKVIKPIDLHHIRTLVLVSEEFSSIYKLVSMPYSRNLEADNPCRSASHLVETYSSSTNSKNKKKIEVSQRNYMTYYLETCIKEMRSAAPFVLMISANRKKKPSLYVSTLSIHLASRIGL